MSFPVIPAIVQMFVFSPSHIGSVLEDTNLHPHQDDTNIPRHSVSTIFPDHPASIPDPLPDCVLLVQPSDLRPKEEELLALVQVEPLVALAVGLEQVLQSLLGLPPDMD